MNSGLNRFKKVTATQSPLSLEIPKRNERDLLDFIAIRPPPTISTD